MLELLTYPRFYPYLAIAAGLVPSCLVWLFARLLVRIGYEPKKFYFHYDWAIPAIVGLLAAGYFCAMVGWFRLEPFQKHNQEFLLLAGTSLFAGFVLAILYVKKLLGDLKYNVSQWWERMKEKRRAKEK